MNQQSTTTSSTRPIGGSILPSSEPRILQTLQGLHGTFQVRPLPELDTHALFFTSKKGTGGSIMLATHANGYSCRNLAERLVAVWEGTKDVSYAMEQFDYILQCGGLGKHRASIEFIAQGLPSSDSSAA